MANAANWIQQRVTTGGTGSLVLGSSYLNGVTFAQAFGANKSDLPYSIQLINGAFIECGRADYDNGTTSLTSRIPEATFVSGTYDDSTPSAADIPAGAIVRCDMTAADYLAFLNSSAAFVSPPSTPTSTGSVAQQAWDGTYLYKCVATNTWVRWVPIRSW